MVDSAGVILLGLVLNILEAVVNNCITDWLVEKRTVSVVPGDTDVGKEDRSTRIDEELIDDAVLDLTGDVEANEVDGLDKEVVCIDKRLEDVIVDGDGLVVKKVLDKEGLVDATVLEDIVLGNGDGFGENRILDREKERVDAAADGELDSKVPDSNEVPVDDNKIPDSEEGLADAILDD